MKKILLSLLIAILFCTLAEAEVLKGRVVKVADGDTITILDNSNRQHKIRLYGIDAPEKRQAFGQKSRQTLAHMVGGQQVQVDVLDVDRYGRKVGVVLVDDTNANAEMLRQGMAWVYTRYCKVSFCRQWQLMEQETARARRGLWIDPDPIPPWEWRKAQKMRR